MRCHGRGPVTSSATETASSVRAAGGDLHPGREGDLEGERRPLDERVERAAAVEAEAGRLSAWTSTRAPIWMVLDVRAR